MADILNTPLLKSTITKLIFIESIILIIIYIVIGWQIEQINQSIINEEIALVGKIATSNNELIDDVIENILKSPTKEEINKGKQILSTYGYTKQLTLKNHPTLANKYSSFRLNILFILSILLIIVILIITIDLHKIQKKIKSFIFAAEKVIDGNYSIKLSEDSEGVFSILGTKFNQMSQRLNLSISKLKEDKTFLKNILEDISHQLKTPLSSLIMFNELLLNQPSIDNSSRLIFLQKSQRQLERMEWLIINLLKLARLEAGSIIFKKEIIKWTIPIEKAITSINHKIMQKKQIIDIIQQENTSCYFDSNWMIEALINILKNCSEHTQENGKITIIVEESPVVSKVIIKDNGKGIVKKDLPHIFKRFYRGSNAVQTEGIGIGLALSKKIIEEQGGTISVKSELGQGTEFEIAFLKGIL